MTALAGPFLIVCTILGLGGLAKLWAPLAARRALRTASIDVPLAAVRFLGLAEVVVALVAIFRGGTIMPIIVGVAYLGFAAFVLAILRTGEGTSCGCFGTASAPPSVLHVAVNVLSAAAAFGAIGVEGLVATLDDQAGAGFALLVLVAVGSYALFLVLTALPVVLAPPQTQVASFSLVEPRDAS